MREADEREDPLAQPHTYSSCLHRARYAIARRHARGAVLDLACGVGYGAFLLNGDGRLSYTGADIDADSIERAARAFGRYGRFVAVDGNRPLPFENATFDAVCSLETIEHLDRGAQAPFYRELVRVLRPGGRLVISTPNRDWPMKRYWRRRGWTNPFHKHEMDRAEFRALAVDADAGRLRIAREHALGFAWQLTALPRLAATAVRPRADAAAASRGASSPARRRWTPPAVEARIHGADLALGRLTPSRCNSLCLVVEKLG